MSATAAARLEALRTAYDYVLAELNAGRWVVSYQSESFTVTRGLATTALAGLRKEIDALERVVDGAGPVGGRRTHADFRNRP